MGDEPLGQRMLDEVRQIPLHDEERATLKDDLQRADDLQHMLQ